MDPVQHRVAAAVAFIVWVFLYFAVPLAVLGRTPGKGLLGTKVQMLDGRPLSGRRAGLRTLVLPLSFLLFGLGLFLGLFRRDRRTLHDLIAGTERSTRGTPGAPTSGCWPRARSTPGSRPQVRRQILEAGVGQDDGHRLAAVGAG